ncbi:MAG: integrase core domain-containing protein, partial [Firmicutes bacterium]|nr:integrase core domain-containing protein [Bacillota bacterium]
HKDYNIIRSMSRVATPTDNCVIEAINGWIKAEMYAEGWHRQFDSPEELIDAFVYYYHNYRPAYSLQYKTPVQYRTDLGFL